jgi:predicted DNA-binding transcriptional regulator YafY
VQWRFRPEAANMAATYEFHPTQTEWFEPDGSFMVRFHSSGLLEMAWYLYSWGDKVEVVEPKVLSDMVKGYQRADFPALP